MSEEKKVNFKEFKLDLSPMSKYKSAAIEKAKSVVSGSIRIRTFNDNITDASRLPELKSIFGRFFHKNQLAILFGDTGLGKTILGNLIALGGAEGESRIAEFPNEAGAFKVLYFDYELSDRQFYKRFKRAEYTENLFRADVNPDCIGCSMTISEIRKAIISMGADLIVIDNLSAMVMESTADPEIALKIMGELKKLAMELNVSVLVLAHTPKMYDSMPITVNHLAGSKHLSNFADSIFALGKSCKGANMRYLKHVKNRDVADTDQVYLLEIVESGNELTFEYLGMDYEANHLEGGGKTKEDRKIVAAKMKSEGKTLDEIASLFGVNKSTVSRWLNQPEE